MINRNMRCIETIVYNKMYAVYNWLIETWDVLKLNCTTMCITPPND